MARSFAVALGVWLSVSCLAQRPVAHLVTPPPVGVPHVDASLGEAIRSLASRAGVVFVGQVIAVQRNGGTVNILFRVEQAVQGTLGATYTLHEWAGLWAASDSRYVPGERAMLFLCPPNAAGLSSPVDGMDGVVPVVPMGAHEAPLLDTRRLAARVQRSVGTPMMGDAVALPDAMKAMRQGIEPLVRRLPEGWQPRPAHEPIPLLSTGVSDVAR